MMWWCGLDSRRHDGGRLHSELLSASVCNASRVSGDGRDVRVIIVLVHDTQRV